MAQNKRETWNERYAAKDLVWSKAPNRMLVAALQDLDLQPGCAMDVACGEGRNAIWLAEEGWQVTALDFSDVAIGKGMRIAKHNNVQLDWVIDDATRWQAPLASMDLVVVLYLHTSSADRTLWMAHVRDALKPGGAFIYIAHDLSNLEQGQGGPQSPDVLATPDDIVALLPGYRIDRAEVLERIVDDEPGHGGIDPGPGVALDALVVASKPLHP